MRDKWRFAIGLLIVIIIGIAARVWLMWRSGWRIEYDEAMLGLMAIGIIKHGEMPVTLAAQPTLGALEAYVLAALFSLFGVNTIIMRVMSLLYVSLYILGVGILGRLAYNKRVGILAGLLASISSLYLIAIGTKVWAGTMGTMAFGTLLLCIAIYVIREGLTPRQRTITFAALGFTGGLAVWTAFLSAYYVVPVALLLIGWGLRNIHRERFGLVRFAVVGLVGFFTGSAPFWIYNATHDWITFQMTVADERSTPAQLWAISQHLMTDLIPRLASGSPEWGGLGASARMLATTLFVLGLVFLPLSLFTFRKTAGGLGRWLVTGVALAVPAIYLISGHARNALNPYGIDATGRYLLMWHSVFPVGLAAMAVWLGMQQRYIVRVLGMGIITTSLTLNLIGMALVNPVRLFDSPYYDRLPENLSPLIQYLDEQGIRYVWTDVGIAHPLIFYTQERIIAADYWDAEIAGGLVRFPKYLQAMKDAVTREERTAYVSPVLPDQDTPPIEKSLNELGIPYSAERVGGLMIYIPSAPVDPADIAAGLGYQY